MPAFANMSFETQGSLAGDAASWTLNLSTAVHWAAFTSATGAGARADDFEFNWGNNSPVSLLDGTNTVVDQFNMPVPLNTPFDDFEKKWLNDGFLFVLAATVYAEFTNHVLPPPDPFDDFEGEWANTIFAFSLASVTTTAALFNLGADAQEDYEAGWGNDSYLFALGATSAALFAEGVLATAETFEGFKADQTFTVTLPSTFNATAHGFTNGQQVKFFPAIDGQSQLPTPLNTGVVYTITGATTNTFQVQSGSTVVMTDAGGGTNYVRTDTTQGWGGRDGDTAGSDP